MLVQSRGILATYTPADERIWGPAVWVSLGLMAVCAFLVSAKSPFKEGVKVVLQSGLPIIALAWSYCLLFTDLRTWLIGESYFYKREYYQLHVAFLISLAFGIGFSLAGIRGDDPSAKSFALCMTPAYAFTIGLLAWVLVQLYTT